MTKVYVVHSHEPMEGSTILYVGTSGADAHTVAKGEEEKNRTSIVDIAQLNFNEVPEERDVTLKVSKRELDEIIDSLDRNEVADLAEYIRGLK